MKPEHRVGGVSGVTADVLYDHYMVIGGVRIGQRERGSP